MEPSINNTVLTHVHPLTRVVNDVVRAFVSLGFEVAGGPELESGYFNFDALAVPKDHPARDMQDTFWIKDMDDTLLRTHTSAVQARYMQSHEPPFSMVVPGKVFRNEATDTTHEMQFFQVEGLVVGEDISLADLKGTLSHFLKMLFGDDVSIRLRPSFFPFVEPGVEVDMRCFKCGGGGCGTCKGTGWIEILGAGMVHPNVLSAIGIDSVKWRGFAFGLGVDRIAMLRYGIDDVRLLYTGDMRVTTQF